MSWLRKPAPTAPKKHRARVEHYDARDLACADCKRDTWVTVCDACWRTLCANCITPAFYCRKCMRRKKRR